MIRRLARFNTAAARALLLGLLVSALVTGISRMGALAGWETRAIDLFLFFRDRVPTPEIVLVLLDEAAFQEMGERQPLPRRYLAELGEFLLQSGAKVVAFDVHVSTPTVPDEDTALVDFTRRWRASSGRVVFTTIATPTDPNAGTYVAGPPFSPELRAAFGYANAPIGADGFVRRLLAVMPAEDGGHLPSFALAALAAHQGYTPETLRAALGRRDIALTLPVGDPARGIVGAEPVARATLADAEWRIDFAGPPGSFVSFPAGVLMQAARSGVKPEGDNPFRGKIVLVGATFAESRDFYPTPLGLMAGVEIQANIVHTLLARRALLPPHWALNLGLMVLACVWVTLLSTRLRGVWLAVASVAFVALLVFASYEAYHRGYWLDFVAPLAVMFVYRRVAGVLSRRRLRSAFGEFVSPDILQRVLREGVQVGSGEVRDVSILMSDVRGFTTMSESLAPDKVSETMNEYFTAMVDVIMGHHGLVQDFIGDGILAVYGAPVDDPEHAWHAVQTALGMQAALRRLNERWAAQGRPTLAIGAAVNSGRAFSGVMGAPQKKKYTVLGDVVNTTSRMEGQNRELGTEILISETTFKDVKTRVQVADRGAVRVKGRAEPVQLFELLGARPDGTAAPAERPIDRALGVTMRAMWLVVLAVLAMAPAVLAQARETAGLVTEIKIGKGKAEIKPAAGDWRAAGPLQALRAGDQVRAADDATLVVVLSGGRGTVKVTAQNSPWTVPAVAADGKAQKAHSVINASLGFLARGTREAPRAVLSTRAIGGPPEILTPRQGAVLGDPLAFEWMGSQFSRYTVRVTSPSGVVLERKGVVGARFTYPADAPRLEPGVTYTLQVEAVRQPVQQSTFEILPAARAAAMKDELAQLEASLGAGASPTSIAVVKAGALADAGLVHDARLVVLAALAKDPDEPTLHTILGTLYMATGLQRQAAEAFDEGKYLLSRDK